MSELLSKDALRVDVEPMLGRAVRRRALDAEGCAALVATCAARTGAQP
jgi:hypothetical protein